MRADLNVIDSARLGFDAPSMAFDLPAGGRRLVQHGRGYAATFVAGVQTVADDEFTGELPGRLVRGPRPSRGRS
jgi:N-acyl-D-aspartate/D-glutamate deacylase